MPEKLRLSLLSRQAKCYKNGSRGKGSYVVVRVNRPILRAQQATHSFGAKDAFNPARLSKDRRSCVESADAASVM